MKNKIIVSALAGFAAVLPAGLVAQNFSSKEKPMMSGNTANTGSGWKTEVLLTVGEMDSAGNDLNDLTFGYKLPGLLDGIGAYVINENTVRILVNHELGSGSGYYYTLNNGTSLRGARVSYADIDRSSRKVKAIGLAYTSAFDRYGNQITPANNVNSGNGFGRFCSSVLIIKNNYGFADNIYLTGEEQTNGQAVAIDADNKTLHVAPMLGRAGFENLSPVENYNSEKVVLLIGDDRSGAPLYLYIGEKGSQASGYTASNFLKNNGLANGNLYVWVADNGDNSLSQFKGTGNSRAGKFVKITHFDPSKAGTTGYDLLGFPNQNVLDANADLVNHFAFSRPEDLAVNPADGTQVVFASTGSSIAGGADLWGTTYLIDFDNSDLQSKLSQSLASIQTIEADLTVLYDGDDAGAGLFASSDYGLRSPDNLDWSQNGKIYIQEDKSIGVFGQTSGAEASVWELDPATGALKRILEMDRSEVPAGQVDLNPSDIGNWESSGILDVTSLFKTRNKYETLFIMDVQGHSVRGNLITSGILAEGGQLLLTNKNNTPSNRSSNSGNPSGESIGKEIQCSVYPNPFNDLVTVEFTLEEEKQVSIAVYDMTGKFIRLLSEENNKPGVHSITWDGTSENGNRLAPGMYYIQLESADFRRNFSVFMTR